MNAQINELLADAVALGGGDLCAAGHNWKPEGGRYCERCGEDESQTVYRCARCGQYDYGEPGGPAYAKCSGTWPCARSAMGESDAE